MSRPSARTIVVTVALLGGACAGVVLAVGLTPGSDRTTVVASPPSTTTPSDGVSSTSPRGAPTSMATTPPPPTLIAPTPSSAPRPDNRSPDAVARNFITGYLAWSWSDQPSPMAAMRQRVRPWVTDRFDAGLAQSSSAAAATATRVAAHEVDVPKIASLDQIAPAGADTVYLSLVSVEITMDGAALSKRSVYIQAKLLNLNGNWYVDELVR